MTDRTEGRIEGLTAAREIFKDSIGRTHTHTMRALDRAIADARQSETGEDAVVLRFQPGEWNPASPSPSVSAPAREIDIDALLEQIERLDDFSAGITIMTKIADHVHVAALRAALPEIVEKMKVTVDWEKRV